ncbi:MAG: DEAD/DEAH box helicase [Candidatus Hodarchaeota archaeon]
MTKTTTFNQLGIIEPILQVCAEEKFEKPTEIQKKSIPSIIEGKDVIGEAATGSGKTLAFASGIIHRTMKGRGIQALIITPTRELALQVTKMTQELSKYKPLRIIPIYGGVAIDPQIHNLKKADVIIGTPGRLLDHIRRNTLNLKRIKILVLDECDRLLDMGFLPDVEKIIRNLPKNRQTLLFSATISYDVNQLAQKYMHEPIDVEAESFVDPNKLTQYYYGPVEDSFKFSLFVHLLKQNKTNELSMVFCNTRRYADFLSKSLADIGIEATSLHGGFSQFERTKRLNKFQNRRSNILIATDVAARGLDIQGVTTIYNYDLPNNRKQYIHRIGRTARAGNAGKAITLVSQKDNEKFFHLFRDNRNMIQKGNIPFVKRIQVKNAFPKSSAKRRKNREIRVKPPQVQYSRYSV